MSLVFYDTETTGTETFFDQILQFAAVQTDEDLKELDSFETRCRILPNVIPAPQAMRVTGVRAAQLTDLSYPSHYELVRAMTAKMREWSPAVFLGWNSIRFDEELVRQALYKTLHKPYLTNSDGNTRSDVMRIAQACSVFAPDALVVPVGDDGRPSFRLDQIAPANGFDHAEAHDAMADVRATMFLCRLIIDRAPHVWSAFMRFSKKASVIDYIKEEPVFCLTDFYFGRPYSWIVTVIGANNENSSEYYVYDLNFPPEDISDLSASELAIRVAQSPKIIRKLKCNAAPMIFSADEAPECCCGRELGFDELTRRAEVLKADTTLCERLVTALESNSKDYQPSPHVECQIYEGFFEKTDEQLMEAFHKAVWPDRLAIVEKLQDLRLRKIGRQLIYFERPDLLDPGLRRELEEAHAKRVLGHDAETRWLTVPSALAEIAAMSPGLSGSELQHIREHETFLRNRHDAARSALQRPLHAASLPQTQSAARL